MAEDVPASGPLAETVYAHLRAIAQQHMNGERIGHTLSATALVHEVYLRIGDPRHPESRAAYYFAAAQAMRRILIERARARNRIKRGGPAAKVSLDEIGDVVDLDAADEDRTGLAVAFDWAFGRLEEQEPDVADVVRLRFFAGLAVDETALALGVSERTVNNRWAYARAWLAQALSPAPPDA